MLHTFLAQLAAGSLLAVSVSMIRQESWKYLRLMGVVCCVLIALAGGMLILQQGMPPPVAIRPALYCLIGAAIAGAWWLVVNAAQGEMVREQQRIWPAVAGIATMAAAVLLIGDADRLLAAATDGRSAGRWAAGISTFLGASLLGAVTAAMLLGHRYLTDTGMSIAPLRRLARVYSVVLIARVLWAAATSIPIFRSEFQSLGEPTWFWMIYCVRVGVGLIMAGIFAWMAWDCVKRRATQSATAIFYLSMIFVFLGELTAQYMLRGEGLAI